MKYNAFFYMNQPYIILKDFKIFSSIELAIKETYCFLFKIYKGLGSKLAIIAIVLKFLFSNLVLQDFSVVKTIITNFKAPVLKAFQLSICQKIFLDYV